MKNEKNGKQDEKKPSNVTELRPTTVTGKFQKKKMSTKRQVLTALMEMAQEFDLMNQELAMVVKGSKTLEEQVNKVTATFQTTLFGDMSKPEEERMSVLIILDDLNIKFNSLYTLLVEKKFFNDKEYEAKRAEVVRLTKEAEEKQRDERLGLRTMGKDELVQEKNLVHVEVKGICEGKGFPGDKLLDKAMLIGQDMYLNGLGFDKKLVGAKVGDVVEFSIEIPKDYKQCVEEIKGKVVHYKVKILKAKELTAEKEQAVEAQPSVKDEK